MGGCEWLVNGIHHDGSDTKSEREQGVRQAGGGVAAPTLLTRGRLMGGGLGGFFPDALAAEIG